MVQAVDGFHGLETFVSCLFRLGGWISRIEKVRV
jgi:hypothetical protein